MWKREEDSLLFYSFGRGTFVAIERSAIKRYTDVRIVDVML